MALSQLSSLGWKFGMSSVCGSPSSKGRAGPRRHSLASPAATRAGGALTKGLNTVTVPRRLSLGFTKKWAHPNPKLVDVDWELLESWTWW